MAERVSSEAIYDIMPIPSNYYQYIHDDGDCGCVPVMRRNLLTGIADEWAVTIIGVRIGTKILQTKLNRTLHNGIPIYLPPRDRRGT